MIRRSFLRGLAAVAMLGPLGRKQAPEVEEELPPYSIHQFLSELGYDDTRERLGIGGPRYYFISEQAVETARANGVDVNVREVRYLDALPGGWLA